ncbi:nitrilase-related carbon-nitrogen hydrolase [Halarsenatibacter silvermanii]|uniref:Carbon-nitrogen hydrolase n=1 Tax=Halarsenatibacter silvermanii TaxID=321763 RepID=A0A1G9J1J0_9FIRM|nr:nitrilase-related carbon-nitrogen hydrolase [Halarsenatibacter silvermanii]SDL31378.1 Carbon-nitrogen hydrolase [Halarsenatibacter silvermanii]
MKIAAVQPELDPAMNKSERIEKIGELIEEVENYDLIILPELWNVGFFSFDEYDEKSETLEGKTVKSMSVRAQELECHLLMGSFVEADEENELYNTSVLLDDKGNVMTTYRKIHLFGYESRETDILSPGKEINVEDIGANKVALSTCYDLRFPELYRIQLERGAEYMLVVSAWPRERVDHWQLLCRTRALENQSYLIAANCAGRSGGVEMAGNSLIISPRGKILSKAGRGEEIIKAECPRDEVIDFRDNFPAVTDRVYTCENQKQ